MFQDSALFDSMTVYDNIALPLKEATPMKPPEIRERVARRMEQLDLNGIEDKYPGQLSGGMKKGWHWHGPWSRTLKLFSLTSPPPAWTPSGKRRFIR